MLLKLSLLSFVPGAVARSSFLPALTASSAPAFTSCCALFFFVLTTLAAFYSCQAYDDTVRNAAETSGYIVLTGAVHRLVRHHL